MEGFYSLHVPVTALLRSFDEYDALHYTTSQFHGTIFVVAHSATVSKGADSNGYLARAWHSNNKSQLVNSVLCLVRACPLGRWAIVITKIEGARFNRNHAGRRWEKYMHSEYSVRAVLL